MSPDYVKSPGDTEGLSAHGTRTAAMEPMLIVFLGVVVGGMIVAMYLPFLALGVTLGVPDPVTAISLAGFSNMFASITHYGIGLAPIFFGAGYVELKEW